MRNLVAIFFALFIVGCTDLEDAKATAERVQSIEQEIAAQNEAAAAIIERQALEAPSNNP